MSSSSSSTSASPAASGLAKPCRFLGGSGTCVSEFCLGALTLQLTGKGNDGVPAATEEVSHQILDAYVEQGGNFIDTADVYVDSEVCIGRWIASKSHLSGFRDSLVLATKVYNPTGSGANDRGLSRKHIFANVEQSLKRLNTSFIDLYQVHAQDNRTDIYDIMRSLNDLVRSGKVRNIGFSNFTPSMAQKAIEYSKFMGLEPFVSNQSQYSLMRRAVEWELIPQCLENNLSFLPWSPLQGGWLSGKYRRGISGPPQDTRLSWADVTRPVLGFNANAQDKTWEIIDELFKVAEEVKGTVAQVALRWLLQKPAVTSVIIGARSVAQLQDNLGAALIKLSPEQMDRLDKASAVPAPYPYNILKLLAR